MVNPIVGQPISIPPRNQPLFEAEANQAVEGDWSEVGNSTEGAAPKVMSTPWYRLFQALLARTGGGSGIPTFNQAIVADAGASQATATPLVPILNFVAASGKGVVMPAALGATNFLVVVNVMPSQSLNVYPPPGCQINALGANAPYVMNPGGAIAKPTVQIFWFQSKTQCWATTLG